ncbi:MAG: hypothetical protein ABWY00_10830 [Dongiaceae bacterium]
MQLKWGKGGLLLSVLVLFVTLAGSQAWAQQNDTGAANPLLGGSASSSADMSGGPASEALPQATGQPGFLHRAAVFVIDQQRKVNRAINEQLGAIKRGGDPLAIWGGLLIAFLYGVFHVVGPGHGKAVIAGYFLGHHANWRRGIAMASWMAVSHVVAAVAIVIVVHLILSRGFATPVDEMAWLRFVSYGAIFLIGCAMSVQAWRGRPVHACGHGPDHHHVPGPVHDPAHVHGPACGAVSLRGDQGMLAMVAGFVPCSGAILILVFCLTNNLLWQGVMMAVMIAFGMALTLSAIGLASIFLRRQTLGRITDGRVMPRLLNFIGPVLIALIGLILFSGALIAPDVM